MRSASTMGWLILTFAMQGCTYSVYPLFSEKELVHSIDLNGQWRLTPDSPDKGEGALIELSGFDMNSAYDFQFGGKPDAPDEFVMKVGKLGDQTFAEFQRLESDGPPIVRGLPVYALAKLELADGVLTLREIDDRKCRKLLAQDGLPYLVHLSARQPDIDNTVMTMPTPQLQEFVRRHHQDLFTGSTRVLRKVVGK